MPGDDAHAPLRPSIWELAGRKRRLELVRRSGGTPLAQDRQARLLKVVDAARAGSPFYAELYRDLPESWVLQDLPVVDKEVLMDNFDRAVTDRRLRAGAVRDWAEDRSTLGRLFEGEFIVANTSGSSGLKGFFAADREEWIETLAFMMLEDVGSSLSLLRRLMAPVRRVRVTWILDTHGHYADLLLFRYHAPSIQDRLVAPALLDITEPIPAMVEALNQQSPELLVGYTSAIVELAREQAAGRLRIRPRRIDVYAEPLTEADRSYIEERFQCDVFATYGATEAAVIAKECRSKRMHVWSDLVELEPVGADRTPTPEGETSHTCLLTNLIKFAQPIIRYDIGDSIVPLGGDCPCGSPFAGIRVIGRTEDTLWLDAADGSARPLLPLAVGTLVADLAGVRQFQVRQCGRAEIRVLFVPETPDAGRGLAREIESNFCDFLDRHGLAGCATVTASQTEAIARGARGKHRRIVSDVPAPA